MADAPSLIGRYEIVSRLGQGGMGSLYLAKDPKIGRLVAIKLVRQEFDSPEARQRFAREAQSAGTLRHPNIVTIFDVDEHAGLPFIAMEYVEGETLGELIRRKAPFSLTTRLQWIEELCAGLAYAHRQGVVHRDIKPANLMIDSEGALKILDFGLARREASKFTQTQAIIGTPNYMSPEQIRAGDVGPRSDMFAVGLVLYELLTYTEAFPGPVHQAMHKILYEEPKPLRQIVPGVDPAIEAILARAIEKEPSQRFDDLTKMRAELIKIRQRVAQQEDSAATIALPQDPAVTRKMPSGQHSPPGSMPPSTPQSAGSRRMADPSRHATLQKKRAAQIESYLSEARKHSESGAFDKARESVDHALVIDPEHPGALQLIDEIAADEVAHFVDSARRELQQGHIDSAEELASKAIELAPASAEVVSLRQTIETTKRETERVRQVQDLLRRARTRYSEGSYEGAIRTVGELLAIDPNNAAARDLQTRAREAIDARAHAGERDAAARAAVSEARALFEKGEKNSAIAKLESFSPAHDLVSGFLASLRAAKADEDLPPPPPSGIAASSPPPTPSLMARAKTEPFGAPAIPQPVPSPVLQPPAKSRMPMYAIAGGAVVVVAAIGLYSLSGRNGDAGKQPSASAPANTPASTAAANKPAAPVVPPPAVVTPPASLTAQPPQNQNDRDAIEAYRLLALGQHKEAAKIVARIARRDPRNDRLSDLRAQIQTVVEAERQRAAAEAAVAAQRNPAPSPTSTAATPANPPANAANPPANTNPSASQPQPAAPVGPPPAPPANVPAPKPDAAKSDTRNPTPETRNPPPDTPAPKPETSPADVERPAIEAAIQEYAKALSSKDIAAVGRVRKFTPAEAHNWEQIFKKFNEYHLFAKVVGPATVNGDYASVRVEEQTSSTEKKGGVPSFALTQTREYKLEKIGGKWMILPPG